LKHLIEERDEIGENGGNEDRSFGNNLCLVWSNNKVEVLAFNSNIGKGYL